MVMMIKGVAVKRALIDYYYDEDEERNKNTKIKFN